jgi:hypothetical protein
LPLGYVVVHHHHLTTSRFLAPRQSRYCRDSSNPATIPASCFVITAKDIGLSRSISNNPHHITICPPTPNTPRLPYNTYFTAHADPLILFLAPKRPPHAHLVDRPARRSGLVPCILLPHGLDRFALRRALWWKQDYCYAERLVRLCMYVRICRLM